jgi:putative two-component system response regulator
MVTEATLDPEKIVQRLREELPAADLRALVDQVFAACRALYTQGRSDRGLLIARELRERLAKVGDRAQLRRAHIMCGLMASDTGDIVGGIDDHVQALRMATADDDRASINTTWNNIGMALANSGSYENALRCFARALQVPTDGEEGRRTAYVAHSNHAYCCYHLGRWNDGVAHALEALAVGSGAVEEADPTSAVFLRRNIVRLMVALGRIDEAQAHVGEATRIAARVPSKRARVAAELTRASLEMARGHSDVALTRLEHSLEQARELPSATRDALACIVRAEEEAGHPARALLRLEELSELIYRSGIERARRHVVAAGFRDAMLPFQDVLGPQARARLESSLEAPSAPEGWKALQRLGASAVVRMDASGFHGMRVGALAKALAGFIGQPPLQAAEIGFACELHDIGMLSVPEGILGKKDLLNDAERAIVLRHSDAGADMLCDAQHPRMLLARDVARYHHARWDGRGHPDRVGGEFIPLAARICTVADAYDSMMAGLSGREPRTMEAALQELSRHSGTQFDPELAAAFDELIRSEMEGRGVDLGEGSGMQDFQELIQSLTEDRGFA